MRLHLRPLGVCQYESFHPKLESQPSHIWNPDSQHALGRQKNKSLCTDCLGEGLPVPRSNKELGKKGNRYWPFTSPCGSAKGAPPAIRRASSRVRLAIDPAVNIGPAHRTSNNNRTALFNRVRSVFLHCSMLLMAMTEARQILRSCRIGNRPLFFIGTFQTGLTVLSQQVRALNLAWAFVEDRQLSLPKIVGHTSKENCDCGGRICRRHICGASSRGKAWRPI